MLSGVPSELFFQRWLALSPHICGKRVRSKQVGDASYAVPATRMICGPYSKFLKRKIRAIRGCRHRWTLEAEARDSQRAGRTYEVLNIRRKELIARYLSVFD
jgi:hypothetical protein